MPLEIVAQDERIVVEIGNPVDKRGGNRGQGYYPVKLSDGSEALYDSVTTALGIIEKPGLKYWAAKEERGAMVEVAIECGTERKRRNAFSAAARVDEIMRVRLGTTQAGSIRYSFDSAAYKAREIGGEVHAYAEYRVKEMLGEKDNKPTLSTKQAKAAANHWEQWREEAKFEPIATEVRCASVIHRFAGRADCAAYVDGIATVIDWKSGSLFTKFGKLYVSKLMQSEAYRVALNECRHLTYLPVIERGMAVGLPKEPGEMQTEAYAPEGSFQAFQLALGLYRWVRDHE